MNTILNHHEIAGALIARVFLGFLFFLQGYDAVFRLKISGILQTVDEPMAEIGVPRFLRTAGVWFTSYVKLICGFMLIIGFAKYYALYLLGADLLIASLAFGLIRPLWDMQFVFPRLALLMLLLLIPSHWDIISVDYVWSIIKFIKS